MIVYTAKHRVPFHIDDADYEAVSYYTWHESHRGSGRITTTVNRRQLHLYVFLLGPAPSGLVWDHIDRDSLNNKRENLRAITQQENTRNCSTPRNNTSGVVGVNRYLLTKWRASLTLDRRQIHLGVFDTVVEAARARKIGEKTYWGIG